MIDFHTHILHDLDDGARTLDEALDMARIAVEDGITTIVATPHSPLSSEGHNYSIERIRQRLIELRTALVEADIPLTIVPGTELYYHHELLIHLQKGLVLPCGDHKAVLLECPTSYLPPGLDQLIFDLQVEGYRVVLAHPERIKSVQKDLNLLLPLVERGVLMQVTASALMGMYGKRMQQVSETMLCHGMAHLLASDAHGAPPRTNRTPQLAAARARATELAGEDVAAALVEHIPAALLRGQQPELSAPTPVQKRGFWSWLSR